MAVHRVVRANVFTETVAKNTRNRYIATDMVLAETPSRVVLDRLSEPFAQQKVYNCAAFAT